MRLLYSDSLHEYRVSEDWREEPWRTWERTEWQCATPLPSVTAVVGEYTQPFDSDAIAAKVAEKRGGEATAESVKAEWTAAADMGTRIHANMEAVMNSAQVDPKNAPQSGYEAAILQCGWTALQMIAAAGWRPIAAEKKVFSARRMRMAGTIDAVFQRGREIMLADWKTNRQIRREGWCGRKCAEPLEALDDCEHTHYSLQLGLYRRLLLEEGYLPREQAVTLAIIHLRPAAQPDVYPVRTDGGEVDRLLLHREWFRDDIPF